MLDIKWIRKNPEALAELLVLRGAVGDVDLLLSLDQQYRDSLGELQGIQAQRNELDSLIAQAKATNRDFLDAYLREAIDLKHRESVLEEKVGVYHQALQEKMAELPNHLALDVPLGQDENHNQEIYQWGTPPTMPWFKDHVTLGRDDMDFEQAATVSGARFVYLKGALARLERALVQWMLDVHTQEFGFIELATPYLVKRKAMFAAGQLPKFASDLFCTLDGRYLLPTAEVSLVNWVAEKVFALEDLPLCITAATPCFRLEAGSAGRDTRGLMRHHQFHKVELVVICQASDEESHHERITLQSETLLQRLCLPYRKVLLCSGDTGIVSRKTYDLEVWVPSQHQYREIASCSQCGDYQGRRLKAKVKDGEGKFHFVHTLNGSALPTGRTLLAILENHQQEDGSILLPSVLSPYMGGQTILWGKT